MQQKLQPKSYSLAFNVLDIIAQVDLLMSVICHSDKDASVSRGGCTVC